MRRIGTVAKTLEVSPRTLVRMERAGLFTARRDRNRARVYDEKDIETLRRLLYPEPTEAK